MSPSDIDIFLLTSTNQSLNTIWGMPDYVCWIIIGICLLISGVFSASENSFSNCNKYHFKVLADEGKLTAKIIVRLVEKFDKDFNLGTMINIMSRYAIIFLITWTVLFIAWFYMGLPFGI